MKLGLLYLIVFLLDTLTIGLLIDMTNFIVIQKSIDALEVSTKQLQSGNISEIITHLQVCFDLCPTYYVGRRIAWLLQMTNCIAESEVWYKKVSHFDKLKVSAMLSQGIRAHYEFRYQAAIDIYDKLLAETASDEVVLFHKGVSLQHLGDIHGAAECYWRAIEVNPLDIKSIVNLAVVNHKYGSLLDALRWYERGIEVAHMFRNHSAPGTATLLPESVMVQGNLGALHLQMGSLQKVPYAFVPVAERLTVCQSAEVLNHLIAQLLQSMCQLCAAHNTLTYSLLCGAASRDHFLLGEGGCALAEGVARSLDLSRGMLANVQRASADWRHWELLQHAVLAATLRSITAQRPFEGPLLPFDTLLLPISLAERLLVATAASSVYLTAEQAGTAAEFGTHAESRALRLGFSSYDFNNHPTAHLVEGIFSEAHRLRPECPSSSRRCSVELFVYSYGFDDNSTYRRSLQSKAHRFVDVSALAHREAAELMRGDRLDVLLDLQMHTLGHRLEVAALRPAALQVNYLVFPGSSGAAFFDFLVADRVVAPPEHAPHYSEALLLLPPTYQVSFYDSLEARLAAAGSEDRAALRRLAIRRFADSLIDW